MNQHTSKKFKKLVKEGPATVDELNGHPSTDERRLYGMVKFNPKDQTTAIWYIDGHDKEKILRRWIDVNSKYLDKNNITHKSMSYSLSGDFVDVWHDIKDEYDLFGVDG